MAPQDILRKFKAQPFRPIRLHISDGASYDVVEPTHAYVGVTEVVVGVELDEYGVPKKSVYLAPNHVTRIEPLDLPEAAGAKGN